MQFGFLHRFLHFRVVFCDRDIQFCIGICQNWLERTALQQLFCEESRLWLWVPPANNISATGKTGVHSSTMLYDGEYVVRHIEEIGVP